MPRTALAIQEIRRNNGAQLTDNNADVTNGQIFDNDGNTILVVHNGDASSRTCTVKGVACSHGRTADVAVAVAAGARAEIGPFDQALFNQSGADAGKVHVDWSAATPTTVKITPVRLAQ